MKNKQYYINAAIIISIIIFCWLLYYCINQKGIFDEKINLKELIHKKIKVDEKTDSLFIDLSKNSAKSVQKSKSIINKIKHETPKIKDTTDIYMYQYIINYRPKR